MLGFYRKIKGGFAHELNNEMRKKLSNKRIEIEDLQDSRVWIASFKLGYGKWVRIEDLENLIIKQTTQKETEESKN